MVGRGEANAYKLSGIASSNTSDSNLHEESIANWLVCAPESRQYHSSSLYKQPRRHSLQGAAGLIKDTMDVVSREEYPHNRPGVLNCIADAESRDRSDWKLVFQKIE